MKYIIKKDPPASLETYKSLDGACFDDMPAGVKADLKSNLIAEQGSICCYCGKRIFENCHSVIEHLLPKGLPQYQHLQLEYSNLLCSCDGGESERTGKTNAQKKVFPPYCDSKKNNSVLKVSPLDENCESYFMYDEEGHIYGKNKEAIETIEILGLDCSTLVNSRKAAIKYYMNLQLSSEEEWENEAYNALQRDQNGMFKPHCFAAAYCIYAYKMGAIV